MLSLSLSLSLKYSLSPRSPSSFLRHVRAELMSTFLRPRRLDNVEEFRAGKLHTVLALVCTGFYS